MKYKKHIQDKELLRQHILSGGTAKEWAYSYEIDRTNVNAMINRLGFRKVYLTPEEAQLIQERRNERQK